MTLIPPGTTRDATDMRVTVSIDRGTSQSRQPRRAGVAPKSWGGCNVASLPRAADGLWKLHAL